MADPRGIRVAADIARALADLAAASLRSDTAAAVLVERSTLYLQGRVRAHASGRPGPRVQTGDYRRSVRATLSTGRTVTGARVRVGQVFTDAPQARRLEYGFTGTDVRGRVYRQPPFPHWAPAVAETQTWMAEQGAPGALRTIVGAGGAR